jgi:hypothetical protein
LFAGLSCVEPGDARPPNSITTARKAVVLFNTCIFMNFSSPSLTGDNCLNRLLTISHRPRTEFSKTRFTRSSPARLITSGFVPQCVKLHAAMHCCGGFPSRVGLHLRLANISRERNEKPGRGSGLAMQHPTKVSVVYQRSGLRPANTNPLRDDFIPERSTVARMRFGQDGSSQKPGGRPTGVRHNIHDTN